LPALVTSPKIARVTRVRDNFTLVRQLGLTPERMDALVDKLERWLRQGALESDPEGNDDVPDAAQSSLRPRAEGCSLFGRTLIGEDPGDGQRHDEPPRLTVHHVSGAHVGIVRSKPGLRQRRQRMAGM
jgi:hypothetical protein